MSYRFLLTRSWLGTALLVVIALAACILLGQWQLGRHEQSVARAAIIESNWSAPAIPLGDVLPSPDAPLPADQRWQPVEVTGSYRADESLYARNRIVDGDVGYYQVVPFDTGRGTLLIVRGFVPQTEDGAVDPSAAPAPPEGEVTVTVRLQPAEPQLDRVDPPGQLQSVSPAAAADQLAVETGLFTGAYGELMAEDPPAAAGRPTELPRPDTAPGPHLSYAFQWWIFAAFFPIGFVVLTRRTAREKAAEDADAAESPAAAAPAAAAEPAPGARSPAGAEPGGTEPRGTEPGGTEPGGAEPARDADSVAVADRGPTGRAGEDLAAPRAATPGGPAATSPGGPGSSSDRADRRRPRPARGPRRPRPPDADEEYEDAVLDRR